MSFSGVDLNTAGAHVLQHVAGLGPGLAEKIVKCRENMADCRFVSRYSIKICTIITQFFQSVILNDNFFGNDTYVIAVVQNLFHPREQHRSF